MSSDAQPDYGDNWLPERGLASGASLKLNVRPGTYKAMWSTCPTGAKDGYYAATLWHETAVEISDNYTQLYAYVAEHADWSAPVTRRRLHGRAVPGPGDGPIAMETAHPARADAEPSVAAAPQPVAKFGAAAFIDPAAAKKAHVAKTATLAVAAPHA